MSTKDEAKEPEAPPPEAPADEAAPESPVEEPLAEDPQEKLLAAQAERDDYKDRMMRALAEAENARTIARRDVTTAREYAVQSFAKSLLEVSDSLG